ncbi:MAG: aminotransferase class III-fold pyridoxal phosphate-dependent enzyme [Gammaproteobacteria bacterium]|nr:aminotransferase class III-fold pyridoxal phosphate-dependent enzyme [Gammaproteobacteria bacterium]
MNAAFDKLQQDDRASLLHPFTDLAQYKQKGGLTFVGAEHIYLNKGDGNKVLDGMSGLWCTSLGYSQPKIVAAVTEQLNQLPYYNSFFNCTTDATIDMAAALTDVLPDGFNHVFFTNSGSEANDTNIRLVHRYFDLTDRPEKKIIIGRKNGYHGSTIAAGSLGGMDGMHKQYRGLDYVHHVDQPYAFEAALETQSARDDTAFGIAVAQSLADKIDELGADKVAAFIAEPVQGAGGVIIPPDSYWPEVERICRERDVLLISDEVICGFGRTGSWFGCQTFGFTPDLITFAKAVTNGFQPLGGVGVGDKVASVLTDRGGEFAHGFTYSGHPVACAAGIATLDIFKETNLVEKVQQDTAVYWAERWGSLADHPIVGEARTKGVLGAIELVRERPANGRLAQDSKAAQFCRDSAIGQDLMVRQVGDAIISAPPLIVNHEEIDMLVARLRTALDQTAAHYGINAQS